MKSEQHLWIGCRDCEVSNDNGLCLPLAFAAAIEAADVGAFFAEVSALVCRTVRE